MNDSLRDLSIDGFSRELAAKVPAPGGGGAAALSGALGAALCSMAGVFTVGKKRYADVEDDVRRLVERSDALRERLIALVEADARAFEPLASAYRIPREDPSRTACVEQAMRGACAVPIKTMVACAEALDLLEEMGDKGSRLMQSDVGCGAALAAGALRAAYLTVLVNTSALADDPVARELEDEAASLLSNALPRADALVERTERLIRTGE